MQRLPRAVACPCFCSIFIFSFQPSFSTPRFLDIHRKGTLRNPPKTFKQTKYVNWQSSPNNNNASDTSFQHVTKHITPTLQRHHQPPRAPTTSPGNTYMTTDPLPSCQPYNKNSNNNRSSNSNNCNNSK